MVVAEVGSAFPMTYRIATALTLTALAALAASAQVVFRSGVDLVHLTVTVSDRNGRFIPGFTEQDFTIFDDGKPQPIVNFSSERAPVSLGVVLDVSSSMTPDKMAAARAAIRRFTGELLGAGDELFLATFGIRTLLLQPWTADRRKVSDALSGTQEEYGTVLYDAVHAALPIAATGTRSKKALLVLTDGNDRHSRTRLKTVQELIRSSDVLVYALAIDGGEGINAGDLRKMTDDTGGRTEVIKGFSNLDAATARVAEELNQQYTMAYAAPHAKDGAWHTIKVEVRRRGAIVRTRSGYQANKVE
jgi:VWFA-related protein